MTIALLRGFCCQWPVWYVIVRKLLIFFLPFVNSDFFEQTLFSSDSVASETLPPPSPISPPHRRMAASRHRQTAASLPVVHHSKERWIGTSLKLVARDKDGRRACREERAASLFTVRYGSVYTVYFVGTSVYCHVYRLCYVYIIDNCIRSRHLLTGLDVACIRKSEFIRLH